MLKSPDQNHNSLLTFLDKEESSSSTGAAATRLEEEMLAARQELETTQSLMEEIRSLRVNYKQQHGEQQTLCSKSQHHSDKVNNNNTSSLNGNLTQQELDKLLDRYDGFVPQVRRTNRYLRHRYGTSR